MRYMTTTSGRAAMELGSRLGRLGVVAVGASGRGLGWMLARCAGCGAALSGSDVLFHDGTTPAGGAWLARRYRLPASVFFLDEGGCAGVYLCSAQGRPIPRESLPPATDWAGTSGVWDKLCGIDDAYAAQAVADRSLEDFLVTVMDLPGQAPLRCALERLGCEILERPRPGVPLLRSDETGFTLTVQDGLEQIHPTGGDAVTAAVEWCLRRCARPLARPAFGPDSGRVV